jgi:hypothetical protein
MYNCIWNLNGCPCWPIPESPLSDFLLTNFSHPEYDWNIACWTLSNQSTNQFAHIIAEHRKHDIIDEQTIGRATQELKKTHIYEQRGLHKDLDPIVMTAGLSHRRTIALSDRRTIGLSDYRSDPDLKCTGVVPKLLCTNITYFHTLYIKTSRDKRSMLSMWIYPAKDLNRTAKFIWLCNPFPLSVPDEDCSVPEIHRVH